MKNMIERIWGNPTVERVWENPWMFWVKAAAIPVGVLLLLELLGLDVVPPRY